MTYRVRIRRPAEADIQQAEDWYDEQRPGLGVDFRSEVISLLYRLGDTPLIHEQAYGEVRRAPVRRFPFLVWYRVSGDNAQVLACSHCRQHPGAVFQRFR
ncbi:type II toxin-antitoxin system RelE/ParE family toxin [Algiphilus aromaticivorans]|uniref:type II toxin-antitoxin system RelE/ParE family toxin n=1 Tax=Algiphilus aromaticivorans TaxID=382454 RepID=UPI0005C1779F